MSHSQTRQARVLPKPAAAPPAHIDCRHQGDRPASLHPDPKPHAASEQLFGAPHLFRPSLLQGFLKPFDMSLNQTLSKMFKKGRKQARDGKSLPPLLAEDPPATSAAATFAARPYQRASGSASRSRGSSERSSYEIEVEESDDFSGSEESRPEYITMIRARGLGKFWVIYPTTMEHLRILDQFHQLTDAIGIRAFLYNLCDCEAYLESTITFLSTFRYESGAVRFRITGPYHEMDLDEFYDRLGVPRDDRVENNKLVLKTWIRIT